MASAVSRTKDGCLKEEVEVASCREPSTPRSLVESFDREGYLCLRGVMPLEVVDEWRHFCEHVFEHIFVELHEAGHTAFPSHSRRANVKKDSADNRPDDPAACLKGLLASPRCTLRLSRAARFQRSSAGTPGTGSYREVSARHLACTMVDE